jgi:hypothetical protein
MEFISGKVKKPYKICFYGDSNIGKSTIASQAEAPIFLDLEDGVANIGPRRSSHIKTFEEFISWFDFTLEQKDCKTIVIDSLDYLEVLLHKKVCRDNAQKSIESFGYGKGYSIALEYWSRMLQKFDTATEAGKNLICTAHAHVKSFSPPDGDAFDRYTIKIHQKSVDLIVAKFDAVFLCQIETILVDDKNKDDRQRAVATKKRIMRTQPSPAWVAKNRFGLPEKIDLSPKLYEILNTL